MELSHALMTQLLDNILEVEQERRQNVKVIAAEKKKSVRDRKIESARVMITVQFHLNTSVFSEVEEYITAPHL